MDEGRSAIRPTFNRFKGIKGNKLDYVNRKILHMQRIGIETDRDLNTARPKWRKEEQLATEKRIKKYNGKLTSA